MTQNNPMAFSAELEAKFQALLKRYPLRRSALVPMLLYAQQLRLKPPRGIRDFIEE